MKERIYMNGSERLLDEFRKIQAMQLELDKAKKQLAEVRKVVRSKSQLIPERIRRLKL